MLDFINNVFDFLINRPLVMLLVMTIPLYAIARSFRVFPSRRLLYLAALPAFASVALTQIGQIGSMQGRFGVFLNAILAIDSLLVVAALFDLVMTVKQYNFAAKRSVLRTASQGKRYSVEVELVNRSSQGCRISIRDDYPDSFEPDPDHFSTRLDGKSRTQFTYDFVCSQRGEAELEFVHVMVQSPLGLWRGYYRLPVPSTINVYPDIQQIAEYDLLARTNRLSLMGLRRSRKIGQDNEFERLRDYTQDDNYKHIDWRSTARRRKLTVRDFQANQSQRIIFMLDCGRMMTGTSGELTLLDHAINAMLMLSYIALRQGDSVGLITFSDRIHNYTPAKSSVKHINRLLHATFNQTARHVESRYDDAFLYLKTNCRKRSLVVLVSNVIDDINARQISQYMNVMTGQHLPLAALLRDHDLYSALDEYEHQGQESNDSEALVYQAAAAANILTWRHHVIRDLQHHGVLAVDVFPEKLTSQLVNQYLEIKARHLL